jgi:hypothetical protein
LFLLHKAADREEPAVETTESIIRERLELERRGPGG